MSAQSYQVVFGGEIAPGRAASDVRDQLTLLALLDEREASAAFSGSSVVLMNDLSYEDALSYQDALKSTGALCRLEPRQSEPILQDISLDLVSEPDLSPQPASPLEPDLTPVSGLAPEPDLAPVSTRTKGKMVCPRCAFEQEQADECFQCGVIIEKFRARAAFEEEAAAMDLGEGVFPGAVAGAETVDDGFFAPERRGIEKGALGGIAMMTIAVVWFVVGYGAGFIFYYPPVLFVIGLYAFVKGLFTGNVAGP